MLGEVRVELYSSEVLVCGLWEKGWDIHVGFGKVRVEAEEDDVVGRLGGRHALLALTVSAPSSALSLLVSLQFHSEAIHQTDNKYKADARHH